jgi:hypothetical protein
LRLKNFARRTIISQTEVAAASLLWPDS